MKENVSGCFFLNTVYIHRNITDLWYDEYTHAVNEAVGYSHLLHGFSGGIQV